jgi:hypothetical protein
MKRFIIIVAVFGIYIGVHGLVSLFCKDPFYDYLIVGFLAAVLICLLYRFELKTRPLPSNCVKTPCPIVYRKSENDYGNGPLYSLPYLDLLRLDLVWGFEIADIKICKTDSKPSSWKDAKISRDTLCSQNVNIRLPDIIEMLIISHNLKKVDRVTALLNENGVKADKFTYGEYWCIDTGLSGRTVPKVVFLRAGNWLKAFMSRYTPKELKGVFFVRFVAKY